jgi:hypothetical protein
MANIPKYGDIVVYGGTTTREAFSELAFSFIHAHTPHAAYDLKILINSGEHDILKPSWIQDCVRRGELVPMRKRYIVHVLLTNRDSYCQPQALLPCYRGPRS